MTWRDTHWALIMLPLRRLLSHGSVGVRRGLWQVVRSRGIYTRKAPKAGTTRVWQLVSLSARRPRFLGAKRSMVSESKVHQDDFTSSTLTLTFALCVEIGNSDRNNRSRHLGLVHFKPKQNRYYYTNHTLYCAVSLCYVPCPYGPLCLACEASCLVNKRV